MRKVATVMDGIKCSFYMIIKFKASAEEGQRRFHETYDGLLVSQKQSLMRGSSMLAERFVCEISMIFYAFSYLNPNHLRSEEEIHFFRVQVRAVQPDILVLLLQNPECGLVLLAFEAPKVHQLPKSMMHPH